MSQNGQSARAGSIVEIKGVVVDAVFPGEMPAIYNALEIKVPASAAEEVAAGAVAEVQQHLATATCARSRWTRPTACRAGSR